jgi:hypothetical protein
MTVIKIPSNKNIELVDLETHVALCEHRRTVQDERILRLETQLEEFEEANRATKKIIIGSLVSIATGVVSTIVAILLKYQLL